MTDKKPSPEKTSEKNKTEAKKQKKSAQMPEEFGGTKGLEPTRYGDWENNGRCTDF
tara:strand:+ start:725 stop:892 length:168 start_codon:yes stop_codon:yes gene_type:complete